MKEPPVTLREHVIFSVGISLMIAVAAIRPPSTVKARMCPNEGNVSNKGNVVLAPPPSTKHIPPCPAMAAPGAAYCTCGLDDGAYLAP